MSRAASLGASALLGLAFTALAFAGAGGLALEEATRVELPLIVVGGLVLAAGALYAPRGPLYGAVPLAAFVGLAALTAVSILWSIVPEESWIEANRTLAYLTAFAAAIVAARLFPAGWPALLGGLLGALGAVAGYALLTRVWPSSLAEAEIYARISAPLGYWNAVGATAAMAVPGALWLGARRAGNPLLNALAYPLLAVLFTTLLLTYSRGALIAALMGVGLWLLLVPLRLRSLVVLAASSAGAAALAAWALSTTSFTRDRLPLAVRESVADEFGLLLVTVCLLMLLAGLAVGFGWSVTRPSIRLRRRVGLAAVAVVLALPLLGVSALAATDRGIAGTISYRVAQLTSDQETTAAGPARLGQVSSDRSRYWRQALRVFDERQGLGVGAGGYGTARLRFREDAVTARHAHGYLPQTVADLGLAGLGVTLLLALAWLAVAARNLALHPWARGRRWSPERIGVAALALTAVVFGFHSALDWTWFVPGPTAMALIAAGWVAGRGPLTLRPDTAPAAAGDGPEPVPAGPEGHPGGQPAPSAAAAGASATSTSTSTSETVVLAAGGAGTSAVVTTGPDTADSTPGAAPPGDGTSAAADGSATTPTPVEAPTRGARARAMLRRDGWRLALALAALAATALSAWAAWQPQRAEAASERALDLVAERRIPEALAAAAEARRINPLSPKPLFATASVQAAARRPDAARRALEQAVRENPADPQTWLRLGELQIRTLNRPREAQSSLRAALYLDPLSNSGRTLFLEARARERVGATRRAPSPPDTQEGPRTSN